MKKHGSATLLVAMMALFASGNVGAQGQPGNAPVFGVGQPRSLEELPAGDFRDAVLALAPTARGNALQILRRSTIPAIDLEVMRVDPRGFIYYVDPAVAEVKAAAAASDPLTGTLAGIGAADAFTLHSKPGASTILYVDFDGHQLIDTRWNAYSGQAVLTMPAYDLDGDPSTFSQAELDRIAESWRRVAEDFAPFDVDVTTEEPPYTIGANGRIQYASNVGHNLVTSQQDVNGYWVYTQGGCGCGGVAYLGVFGNSFYQPGLTFNRSLGSNALTISHETGHNLGLGHDGTSTSGYYGGHGSGETSWGPIMGAPFGDSLTQWSNGDYPDANNPEDDFAVINRYLGYRTDDHEDVVLASATPLLVTAGTNVVATTRVTDSGWVDTANKGVIEDRNDADLFSVSVGPGTISLSVTAADREGFQGSQGANLDIQATLLDVDGTVLQVSNPDASTAATIDYLVSAGTYYLEVIGVGRSGTGGSDLGHSDYGSVGQYYINGTVPQDVVATEPPTAPDDLAATLVGEADIQLAWTDPASGPEADEAGYRVLRAVDGGAFAERASLPRGSESFADNNLASGRYAYAVEAYNGAGSATTPATAPITIDRPNLAVASSESTALGSVTAGSYLGTQQAAGSETLSEEHSGGNPRRRVSSLDHSWFVTGVIPGSAVELRLSATAGTNGENDDFAFSYVVEGAAPVAIGTLGAGLSETFVVSLDPTVSGTIEINVVDTDRTAGTGGVDTVTVHEISITSTGEPGQQPPSVRIVSPAAGISVAGGTEIVLQGEADDYEDGDLGAAIAWESDIDGYLGSGPNLFVTLSGGTPAATHVVTASVTDSAGRSGSASIDVVVDDTPAPSSVAVADLDAGATAAQGGRWDAAVTITVADDFGNAVSGAEVSGAWSNGANGTGNCTTDSSGICTLTRSRLKSNVPSVDFSVTGIVAGALAYDPGANGDPDGDSDGTTIRIAKP